MIRFFSCLLLLAFVDHSVNADDRPFLHQLFTDHMVMQRDIQVPVWGWTEPGKQVTVAMNGKTAVATADKAGKWMAKLGPFNAGGPFELTASGPQAATVKDVLVGEVWVCSGQSNMEWPVAASDNPQQEIDAASHPGIRLFSVPKRVSGEPEETVNAAWQICDPSTISGFSAVGYFFGRELNQRLDVPVGLIHTSWGGTIAEAWTSAEALKTMDDFRPVVESFQETVAAQKSSPSSFDAQMEKWWNEVDQGSRDEWQSVDAAADGWKTMPLPTQWERVAGMENYDGVVWFRREISLPEGFDGVAADLSLGPIDDVDTTWVNGTRVGGLGDWNVPRNYKVPAGVLKPGRNIIAVRVLDTSGGGGIFGQPDQMHLKASGQQFSLAGDWAYMPTAQLGKIPAAPQRTNNNPNVVTVLYNGMLAPLLPYGVKGAIWYQGESNAGRAIQYRTLLPTMINDWKTRFQQPDFSFHVVQLANFMAVQDTPVQAGWASLREAQLMTAQNDPKVGLAVITDIGDAADIHPRNKQDVGKRLSLQALKISYKDESIVAAGPTYEAVSFKGATAVVTFSSIGGGLIAKAGELKGFAVSGKDRKFVWAEARINGDTVVVSSPEVTEPTAVRYNWANNPIGNLFNKEGLPAGPFRSDVDETP